MALEVPCILTSHLHHTGETDVNIGIRIVRDAFRDVFDVCYLVSADTDLAPAIRMLKREFPKKEFVNALERSADDVRHGRLADDDEVREVFDRYTQHPNQAAVLRHRSNECGLPGEAKRS